MAVLASVPMFAAARIGAAFSADVGSASQLADPWSAFFEGMSGITSTGLTMVEAESRLPHALQWWRSVLEWCGGAGVVVFVLALTSGEGGRDLYEAEGRSNVFRENVHATARRIWRLLVGLTAFSVLALLVAGAEPWEALNHGLTGISTGGMVITDESFVGASVSVRVAGMVIMIVGAMSYGSLGLLLRRDIAAFLRLTQVRALGIALVGGGLALTAVMGMLGAGPGTLDAAFMWVSALTTCGFSTAHVAPMPAAAVLLLLGGMFVGGSAGSTAGGIKLRRAAWLGKAMMRGSELLGPEKTSGAGWRMDGRPLPEKDGNRAAVAAAALATAYAVSLAVGTLLLSLSTQGTAPLRSVMFDVMSALSTVGLTAGVAGPDLPWHGKAELIVLMWMGRLEIIAVAVLVGGPLIGALRWFGRRSRSDEVR